MQNVVKSYWSVPFGFDLRFCPQQGIMYQANMNVSVDYDQSYFDNYIHRKGSEIAIKLNKSRVVFSHQFCKVLLDVGIGSGEFIESSHAKMYGFDINPVAVEWLKARNIYVDPYVSQPDEIEGWTMWDTLEHIPEPQELFVHVRSGQYLFISLPIFENILTVRQSKHYKPNEHYYYFTSTGFIRFMTDSGFELEAMSDNETLAGRESIYAYAFRKI
jgi:hypothetical protein